MYVTTRQNVAAKREKKSVAPSWVSNKIREDSSVFKLTLGQFTFFLPKAGKHIR